MAPSPDRQPARRAGPDRALQLGVRPPPRRHLRAPDRGHRRRPQHPGVLRRPVRPHAAGSGLDWDEGPDVGGPYAPYRQSERGDHLPRRPGAADRGRPHVRLLLHHRRGRRAPQGGRLQGAWATTASAATSPTSRSRRSRPRAGRRSPGSGCPTARSPSTTWCAARSPSRPSTCPTSRSPAPTATRSTRWSTRVDDALMEITHVLRGEDLLSSTPRQIALYAALADLGIGAGAAALRPPALRHGRGQQEALQARPARRTRSPTATRASCPRACSTTWPCSAGRSPPTATSSRWTRWSRRSTSATSTPTRRASTSRSAEAINAAHMRLLPLDDIAERVLPVPARPPASSPTRRRAEQQPLLDAAMPLVAERINKLTEAVDMLGFLFVDEASTSSRRRTRSTTPAGPVVQAAYDALAGAAGRGRPPRSRRRCAPRWSRSSGSSRATRSARSGSPSPAAGSRRRCSSRSSCSAASAVAGPARRRAG